MLEGLKIKKKYVLNKTKLNNFTLYRYPRFCKTKRKIKKLLN